MTFRKTGETVVLSPLRRASLLIMAFIFLLSATAFAAPPIMYDVTIIDGTEILTLKTAEKDGAEVLKNADIVVNESYGDTVSFQNFNGENGSTIIIKRGVKVTINNFDGTQYTIYASGTVKDAIEKAEITLRKGTALNYSAGDLIEEGMVIEIYDIYKIKVIEKDETIVKVVSGKTVSDALNVLGIEMGENDFTEPKQETNLKNGMTIEIFRVEIKERKETEEVNYGTDYKTNDNLYKDEKKVVKEGVKGSKAVVYEDFYVNGELQSSTEVSSKIIKEPVNQIVEKGTKNRTAENVHPTSLPTGKPISELANPSYLTIGTNGLPTSYKSSMKAKATAYCSPGDLTSTGKRAQNGYIAVDPKEIPYGTEMYIVSADGKYVYGYCIAADTGSYIYSVDWTVDLHMNSEAQCRQWGRRDIIIYFL